MERLNFNIPYPFSDERNRNILVEGFLSLYTLEDIAKILNLSKDDLIYEYKIGNKCFNNKCLVKDGRLPHNILSLFEHLGHMLMRRFSNYTLCDCVCIAKDLTRRLVEREVNNE